MIRSPIRDGLPRDIVRGLFGAGGAAPAPPPDPSLYFSDAFNNTTGAHITVAEGTWSPTVGPATGGYTDKVDLGAGTDAIFRVNYVLDRLELNSPSGTDSAYIQYLFGETLNLLGLDWKWQASYYPTSGYGNGGNRCHMNWTIGINGTLSTTQVECVHPGGNTVVTCPATTSGVLSNRQVTWDGANIRYYVSDTLVFTFPHTTAINLSYIYFSGTTFGTVRPAWDEMTLWINGLRP